MPFDEQIIRHIGKPLRRTEDQRLLTGKGRFTDDFNLPGQTWAAMVRAPHPHARILHIDGSRARAMPGVLGIFTGQDCADDGLGPIPHNPLPKTRYDLKLSAPDGGTVFEGPHVLLPADKARHVGEAVAMVVAETKAQALDAAEAVDITYEVLPFVAHSEAAIKPGAPAVWDGIADNTFIDTSFGDETATDAAFAAADHVIEKRYHIGRVTAVTMEPRAALGHFDADSGRYTLYAGSGGAVRQKHELSSVLGIDPENLRVLSHDVGGNFGARNRVYVEFGLVLWASEKLRRPVKYTATRSEALLTDYQGRDLVTRVSLALDRSGRFLALRADNISNAGARCVSLSPLGKGSALVTGAYHIPVATMRARAVFTNTMPTQAYRSSGRPEVTFAIERLIDAATDRFGFDRVALRRRNLVTPGQMPYANPVGAVYDSGEYESGMDRAMAMADWNGFPARKTAAASRGRLAGIGLANYVESSIGAPRERAEIEVGTDGRVRVVIGTQPSGQGHETSFAQVVADLLAVPVESVDIVLGDTDIVRLGGGSHSGRSMRHAATVFALAAQDLIERGRRIVAVLLQTAPEAVHFAEGRFRVPGAQRSFDFPELADAAAGAELPEDLAGGLAVARDNEMHDPVFPNGCHVCEVEVDPETGAIEITRYAAVDDVGRCINPLIVHGQTHGGIAQGVGQAMWEQCVIDPQSGQPVCGSLMDYAMPRADRFPAMKTDIAEVLSPTNPLGIKAGGEGGTTPALAVIVSAVADALRDYGVADIEMPLTPQKVWQAIREHGKS
ncbi:MAG: xanthine dehydrogenase family protein molybdopterin-binding subunit [Proteobacteria bacterium]|nr:xanthine dehydrogenase family protein molybdopterin-binding subunit [Pseudomonadota bacterium]